MQLVARVEKVDPPTVAAVCAAAALAAVGVLSDPRATDLDGPWHGAVSAWTSGPIRKLTRRARGATWTRAQEPDGVTIERDGAEVRAFVPCRMDQVPGELAKLQIQSSPLDSPTEMTSDGLAPRQGLTIAVAPDIDMSWGKQAAQCAHAAQIAWRDAGAASVEAWFSARAPLRVVHPDAALWHELLNHASVRIHDGGFTEVPAGTLTVIAWWAV